MRWWCKFVADGFHEIHENWAPTKYNDFTVSFKSVRYLQHHGTFGFGSCIFTILEPLNTRSRGTTALRPVENDKKSVSVCGFNIDQILLGKNFKFYIFLLRKFSSFANLVTCDWSNRNMRSLREKYNKLLTEFCQFLALWYFVALANFAKWYKMVNIWNLQNTVFAMIWDLNRHVALVTSWSHHVMWAQNSFCDANELHYWNLGTVNITCKFW